MKRAILFFVVSIIASTAVAGGWKYKEFEDQMRGTKGNSAYSASLNKADFKFPYSGGSGLLLALNKEPGIDGVSSCGYAQCSSAMLIVINGQMSCPTDQCFISAKFDGGQIEKFKVDKVSHDSISLLKGEETNKFIMKLKASKKLIVEAGFYDEGLVQFTFNIEGLKWENDRASGLTD